MSFFNDFHAIIPKQQDNILLNTYTQINFNKLDFSVHGNMQGNKESGQHCLGVKAC
jgi:hypothetical protein